MLMQMQKISKSFQYLDGRAVKWPLTYAKLLSRDQQFFAKVVKQIFKVNRKTTFLAKKTVKKFLTVFNKNMLSKICRGCRRLTLSVFLTIFRKGSSINDVTQSQTFSAPLHSLLLITKSLVLSSQNPLPPINVTSFMDDP